MRDAGRSAPLRAALAALVLGWLPVLSWPAPADASTPADLDSAFGAGGIVDVDPGDRSYASHGLAATRDSSGRLLVAGRVDHALRTDTLVARFTAGGAIDTTFGDGGYVLRPSDFGFFEPTAITTAPDGTIWVAGWTNTAISLAFGLVRDTLVYHFSDDGDLLGRLIQDFGGDDRANSIAVVGAKVLIAGYARPRGATHFEPLGFDRDLYVARLDAGTTDLDPTFGDGGVRLLDEGTTDDFSDETALAVAAGPSGTVVAGGHGIDGSGNGGHLLAVRLTAGGDLDTSFSGDGIASRPAGFEPTAGTVDASRRIVLAGQDASGTSVARFTAGGAADTTFSTDGTATIGLTTPTTALTSTPDGGLAVSAGLVVARLTSSGNPVTGFGTNGVSRAADRDHLGDGAAVVDDTGKVWLTGSTTDLTDSSGGDDQPTDLLAARLTATGVLDTSFGSNGRRALDLHLDGMTQLRTVRVDAQGRLVVAGVTQADPAYHQDLYLARYTAAGALDPTFGDGGVTIENLDRFDLGYDEVRQIAFDSLGRIVVVGSAYSQLQEEFTLVARFTAAGALDTGFAPSSGVPGVGYLDGAGPGRAVAVDAQDRILVGWTTATWGGSSDLQVTRLLASGAVDTTYGNGGTASIDVGAVDDTVAIVVDGTKLLVAGQADDAMAVARLTATGAADTTFSGDGIATATPQPPGQRVRGLVVDASHRPVLAGTTQSEGTLVRFTAGGALDSGFGTNGAATIRAADAQTQVTGLALDGDRVVAAVTTWPGADYDIGVARVNADGTMDPGFDGGDGVATVDQGAWELSSQVVVLGTGRIVVAGTSQFSNDLPPAELPNIFGTRQFADGLLVGFRGGASVAVKTLTVQRAGTGGGDVTATGIDCGLDCSETYLPGTVVTLTATAQSGSTFAGWTGCTPIDATRCQVTMSAARTVTATFDAVTSSSRLLTVSRSGLGSGRVLGPGIDCGGGGSDCTELFLDGSAVNLTAIPDVGSTFGAWTGCDTTSGTSCDLTVNGATRNVTARFDGGGPTFRQLSVTTAGGGAGQVHDDGGQISCPGSCSGSYPDGTIVTLTATADAGSSFTSWTGCPQPNGATCRATMSQNRSITASFAAASAPDTSITQLTVRRARHRATLTFTGVGDGIPTFQCRLDGKRWRSCTSPKTYTRLSAGWHTVKVRAVVDGVKDPTPAQKTFRI